MKRCVLCAINAKYIHSNLAVLDLKSYAGQVPGFTVEIAEYTINHQRNQIVAELAAQKPDLLVFSCYIWNITLVREIGEILHLILPDTVILLGGPEVSFDCERQLTTYTFAKAIVKGEGERAFREILESWPKLETVDGLLIRSEGGFVDTGSTHPVPLDAIPFPYSDLSAYENRIIYYESSRGCPFHCGYCLSSTSHGVRFLSLERTCSDLLFFLERRVPQVKFIDRTFNCDKERTFTLLSFLKEHDNGVTNFHMEICADLLDDRLIALIDTLRPGLVQFEIGVQSTNEKAIQAVHRAGQFEKIKEAVRRIDYGRVHIHLDLIAGLPYEDYQSFGRSFDDVYSQHPHQLQLGFLKLLRGSELRERAAEYGAVFYDVPPYEVLYTDYISYLELQKLKGIEELVELYYNSGRFQKSLAFAIGFFPRPFLFYEAFSAFYRSHGHHLLSHSKTAYYDILFDFFKGATSDEAAWETMRWALKFDLYSREKAKKLPDCVTVGEEGKYHQAILSFYEKAQNLETYLPAYRQLPAKQVYRLAHIEVFPFDILAEDFTHPKETAVLFDYSQKSLVLGATIHSITL